MVTRRTFFKNSGLLLAGAALSPRVAPADDVADDVFDTPRLPLPTPAQVTWQDCEVGLVYHFDMPVAAGVHTGNNTSRKIFDTQRYNPTKLDTDQWIEAAKVAGAKYAVFTATHFNGFMQWQSDLYPYGVKQARWRGGKADVVGDFVDSCHKAGIKPGIYFSTHRNVYQSVWGYYVDWGRGRGTQMQEAYNRIAEKQLEELCSRYGKLVQIWFDAGTKLPHEGGPDMLPIFAKHQPDSVFYHSSRRSDHRWIGNERGFAKYPCWATMPMGEGGAIGHNCKAWKRVLNSGDPDGAIWSPGMVDTPLRNHNWFWAPGQDNRVSSLDLLMKQYNQSVGRNCNLLLGEVVTSEGLVPEHDIKRLAEFGKEVQRRFGNPIAETAGKGNLIELRLPRPQRINHMIAMEDITQGERVRQYSLEGLVTGGKWQVLCEGQCIAHKRIESFEATEVAAIRLCIKQSSATPHIKRLAAFNVS